VLDQRFSNGEIDAAGLEVTFPQKDTAAFGDVEDGDTHQASGGVGRVGEANDRIISHDATDDSILANGRGVGVGGSGEGVVGGNVAVKGEEGGGGHGDDDKKMGGREGGDGVSGSDDEDKKKKAGGEDLKENVAKEKGGQSADMCVKAADMCEIDKSSETQSDKTAASPTGQEWRGLEVDGQRPKPSLLQARKPTVEKNRGGGEGNGGKGEGSVLKGLGRGGGGDKDAFKRKRVGSNDEKAAVHDGEGAAEKKEQRQQKLQLPEELQPKLALPPAPLQVPLEPVLHLVPQRLRNNSQL